VKQNENQNILPYKVLRSSDEKLFIAWNVEMMKEVLGKIFFFRPK